MDITYKKGCVVSNTSVSTKRCDRTSMLEHDEDGDHGQALKDDFVKGLGSCLVPERSYNISISVPLLKELKCF